MYQGRKIQMLLLEMVEIARNCGNILLNAEIENGGIYQKEGKANLVTEYDSRIQKELRKKLLKLLPGAGFMGEEDQADQTDISKGYAFIVDPIDGTTNFVRNARASCISIALAKDGNPITGVVHNPYAGETFYAAKGEGAFLNDATINSSNKTLEESIIYFGTSPYEAQWAQKSFQIAYQYFTHGADLRRSGSAALDICDVACGRGDFFFELRLNPWDYAAAACIASEAGCIVSDLEGRPVTYDRKQIVSVRGSQVRLLPLDKI
jgi:myo-inositol-1(or 4)-monophosphatase